MVEAMMPAIFDGLLAIGRLVVALILVQAVVEVVRRVE